MSAVEATVTYARRGCVSEPRALELRAAAASIANRLGEPRICTDSHVPQLVRGRTAAPCSVRAARNDNCDVLLICAVCTWRRRSAA